jgi:hypothetical protein
MAPEKNRRPAASVTLICRAAGQLVRLSVDSSIQPQARSLASLERDD